VKVFRRRRWRRKRRKLRSIDKTWRRRRWRRVVTEVMVEEEAHLRSCTH
jgi:hypothetical protein